MPRDGSGVYSKPAGTTAVPNTTIESTKYNSQVDDMVADLNAARPITAGGTGATSAAGAQTNLGVLPLSGGTMTGTLLVPQVSLTSGADTGGLILLNGTNGLAYFTGGGDHSWSGSGFAAMTYGGAGLSISTAGNINRISVTGYGPSQGVGMSFTAGVAGSSAAMTFSNPSAAFVGSITTDAAATTYNTSSDHRLKSDIVDLTDSNAFISALRPRRFIMGGEEQAGFIAHEFAEVSPRSVFGEKDAVDEEGNPIYQAMQASTSEVIAHMVAELQSLHRRVAELEAG